MCANLKSLVQERPKGCRMQHGPSVLADQGNVKGRRHTAFTERLGKPKIAGMPVIPACGYNGWVNPWLWIRIFHGNL
jgi:hypothetical protein